MLLHRDPHLDQTKPNDLFPLTIDGVLVGPLSFSGCFPTTLQSFFSYFWPSLVQGLIAPTASSAGYVNIYSSWNAQSPKYQSDVVVASCSCWRDCSSSQRPSGSCSRRWLFRLFCFIMIFECARKYSMFVDIKTKNKICKSPTVLLLCGLIHFSFRDAPQYHVCNC